MFGPKKNLTRADFQRSQRLYYGKLRDTFYFGSHEIFELENGEFFIRQDLHMLPLVGFFPEIEIFRIDGELVLIYLQNWYYTYIEPIRVIKSKLVQAFEGFEYGRRFRLQNNQIWQQTSHNYTSMLSSGYVKIIRDRYMRVDNWSTIVEVQDVTNNIPFNILWVKTYIVRHSKGQFKILLAKHINNVFHGTVLYHLREGDWVENRSIELTVQHQNFTSWDEAQVYDSCVQWIRENLGGNFTVDEPSITDYQ